MRVLIYCLLAMPWPVMNAFAQGPPGKGRPLGIGDPIPSDLEITNIFINYPVSKIRLSELKDKLIILDFWATWCSSCVKALPKMHALQETKKNDLLIVLVNPREHNDTEERVAQFLDKRKALNAPVTLPIAFPDTVLRRYFSYKMIPHCIWIYKGKVVAATDTYEVSSDKIDAFLQQGILPTLKIDRIDPNYKLPLKELLSDAHLLSSSPSTAIYSYVNGFPGGYTRRFLSGSTVRQIYINMPLYMLFAKTIDFPNHQLHWEPSLRDLMQTSIPKSNEEQALEWRKEHLFSVEVFVAKGGKTDADIDREIKKRLFQQMSKYFHIRYKEVSREIPCYVLSVEDLEKLKQFSNRDDGKLSIVRKGDTVAYRNIMLSHFAGLLNMGIEYDPAARFVYDNTQYKHRVSITVIGSQATDNCLDALSTMGITVRRENCPIKVGYLYKDPNN